MNEVRLNSGGPLMIAIVFMMGTKYDCNDIIIVIAIILVPHHNNYCNHKWSSSIFVIHSIKLQPNKIANNPWKETFEFILFFLLFGFNCKSFIFFLLLFFCFFFFLLPFQFFFFLKSFCLFFSLNLQFFFSFGLFLCTLFFFLKINK